MDATGGSFGSVADCGQRLNYSRRCAARHRAYSLAQRLQFLGRTVGVG